MRISSRSGRVWTALVASMWLGAAIGHHPGEAQLAGARLCLDASSIEVTLTDASGEAMTATVDRLERDVRDAVERTFTALDVDWRPEPTCDGGTDRVVGVIEARHLDPATYRNFPESTFSFMVVLRVEGAQGTDRAFVTVASGLYAAAGGERDLEEHLLHAARDGALAMAAAWWEDDLEGATVRGGVVVPAVASGVGVLVVVGAWAALRRVKAGRRPGR